MIAYYNTPFVCVRLFDTFRAIIVIHYIYYIIMLLYSNKTIGNPIYGYAFKNVLEKKKC